MNAYRRIGSLDRQDAGHHLLCRRHDRLHTRFGTYAVGLRTGQRNVNAPFPIAQQPNEGTSVSEEAKGCRLPRWFRRRRRTPVPMVAIGRGIKGGERAVVRGNLSPAYAEEGTLLITGNISTRRALMNCRVKCSGRLIFIRGR